MRLADLDLTGTFALDGRVAPALAALPPAPMPVDLSEDLFAFPPPAPAPAVITASTPITPPRAPLPAMSEAATTDLTEASDALARLPGVGDVIDKYRIDAELGRGGFAVVYRATHLLMQTTVALKLLFPWMLQRHPDLADQLCEEARFTSLVDHPNVVRVADVTSTPEATFIVMEYIDGPSLARTIARKPMASGNVIKVGIHIANGLKAALAQGLVHRDIKPGNILLARTGHPKIVDFGLARHHGISPTDSGTRIAGTPAYIAPEQARDPASADFRADIYALGATLYHAAVGHPPFTGADPINLINQHLTQVPPHPVLQNPGFDPGLGELLMDMLEKDPARRPATYDDLIGRLMALHRRTHPPTPAPEATRNFMHRMRGLFRE